MKIYLAAKFERRLAIRPWADALWTLGHEVVSSWLNEVSRMPGMSSPEFYKKLAIKDLTEIRAADLLILDTAEASERGGKEVEWGYALGQFHGKLVWIVGPQRNVFHYLADRVFPDWATCLQYLKEEYDALHRSGE